MVELSEYGLKKKMNKEEIIDTEKALEEKKAMQKIFVREHGYLCPVLILVIAWLEEIGEKKWQNEKLSGFC
jgi:hypothetical protein